MVCVHTLPCTSANTSEVMSPLAAITASSGRCDCDSQPQHHAELRLSLSAHREQNRVSPRTVFLLLAAAAAAVYLQREGYLAWAKVHHTSAPVHGPWPPVPPASDLGLSVMKHTEKLSESYKVRRSTRLHLLPGASA